MSGTDFRSVDGSFESQTEVCATNAHHYLNIPFVLFQMFLSADGFSFLGSGFLIGFAEGDGDGDGDAEGEGDSIGLGAALAALLLPVCPSSTEVFPRHQRAARTPEPRIATSTIVAAAARRNRFWPRAGFSSGTFIRANSGRRRAATAAS